MDCMIKHKNIAYDRNYFLTCALLSYTKQRENRSCKELFDATVWHSTSSAIEYY